VPRSHTPPHTTIDDDERATLPQCLDPRSTRPHASSVCRSAAGGEARPRRREIDARHRGEGAEVESTVAKLILAAGEQHRGVRLPRTASGQSAPSDSHGLKLCSLASTEPLTPLLPSSLSLHLPPHLAPAPLNLPPYALRVSDGSGSADVGWRERFPPTTMIPPPQPPLPRPSRPHGAERLGDLLDQD
jgi:hypothetical protein